MSLFDTVASALTGQGGMQGMISAAMQSSGGFQGILDKLNNAGLGAKVNSWLGQGDNMPITVTEIEGALGGAHLAQLAANLGVSADQVAGLVSQHLPTLVDQASPNGTLQPF